MRLRANATEDNQKQTRIACGKVIHRLSEFDRFREPPVEVRKAKAAVLSARYSPLKTDYVPLGSSFCGTEQGQTGEGATAAGRLRTDPKISSVNCVI